MLTLAKSDGSGAQVKHFSKIHMLMYPFPSFMTPAPSLSPVTFDSPEKAHLE